MVEQIQFYFNTQHKAEKDVHSRVDTADGLESKMDTDETNWMQNYPDRKQSVIKLYNT